MHGTKGTRIQIRYYISHVAYTLYTVYMTTFDVQGHFHHLNLHLHKNKKKRV